MKKLVALALMLTLLSGSSLASAASDSYTEGYRAAILNGIPTTSHEFFVRYLIRANYLGADIAAHDTLFGAGNIISYKYAALYFDENDDVQMAFFSLPERGADGYNEALRFLVSFIYAFERAPGWDSFIAKNVDEFIDIANPVLNDVLSATETNPHKMRHYDFYTEKTDTGRTITAVFGKR